MEEISISGARHPTVSSSSTSELNGALALAEKPTGPDEAERFLLTLWTDDPDLAARADAAGIDRIGVDLEREGKHERQHGLGTWISPHSVDRLPALREAIEHAQLFARANPLSPASAQELERVLADGVEVVMLPMFQSAEQAARFIELVDGRAKVVLLLETLSAARDIESVVRVPGVREIHVGINDLALSMGMRNRFEVLDCELIEHVAASVCGAGIRLGVGGIGRVDDIDLPISSDLIYAQYPRLGATAALISRAFLRFATDAAQLRAQVAESRARMARWFSASPAELEQARHELREALDRCTGW